MFEIFWGTFGFLAATFIAPLAGASEPLALSLPQDVNYVRYISSQLDRATFSSNPRVAAEVDVGPTTSPTPTPLPAQLEAFIISPRVCTGQGDNPSYRLFIRNVGDETAHNITIQFHYPAQTSFVFSDPQPRKELDQTNTVEWFLDSLPGGEEASFSVVLEVDGDIKVVTTSLTVRYDDTKSVATQHTIDGDCELYDGPTTPLPADKQPAIVCDPAEIGCTDTYNQLNLGPNYQKAQDPQQQPKICADGSLDTRGCTPNRPILGARFNEAIADISPGECRVLEDDIITTPPFQDAFVRQGDPAAYFMFPLYNSGQDFKRLVHENVLLGITQLGLEEQKLRAIHRRYWDKVEKGVQQVLGKEITTAQLRRQLPIWLNEAHEEVLQAQKELHDAYVAMQNKRKEKFDPVAEKAVANAKDSIKRACSVANDGGLADLLPPVKTAYDANLDQRLAAYDAMQVVFADPNSPVFPEEIRATTNDAQLQAALAQFDQNNSQPLKEYLQTIGRREQEGFNQAWQLTYKQHNDQDEVADNAVRLNNWEIALDTPKTVATECEKEKRFGPRVETTWCESGSAPELILHGGSGPASGKEVAPPEPINGGKKTPIFPGLVSGHSFPEPVACRGLPGDPWWSADCTCSCDQLLPMEPVGTIGFCQFGNLAKPINRHDIYVTSQLECLADDGPNHNDTDPFLF